MQNKSLSITRPHGGGEEGRVRLLVCQLCGTGGTILSNQIHACQPYVELRWNLRNDLMLVFSSHGSSPVPITVPLYVADNAA